MKSIKPIFFSGFTLIELLVTITIIGILASISMALYDSYRSRAFMAVMQNDVRNISIGQEAYLINHASYATCSEHFTEVSGSLCSEILPGFPGFSNRDEICGASSGYSLNQINYFHSVAQSLKPGLEIDNKDTPTLDAATFRFDSGPGPYDYGDKVRWYYSVNFCNFSGGGGSGSEGGGSTS